MFSFLKDKLKSALSVFSKKVEETEEVPKKEEEPVQEEKEEKKPEKKKVEKKKEEKKKKKEVKKELPKEKKPVKEEKNVVHEEKPVEKETAKEEEPVEKEEVIEEKPETVELRKPEEVPQEEKGFFTKLKETFVGKKEEVAPEQIVEAPAVEEKPAEEKGFFASIKEKITTRKIGDAEFGELFWELELALLENNVAVSVIEKIKEDLKKELVDKALPRSKIQESVAEALKKSVTALFDFETFDLVEKAKTHKPLIVCLVGVNGSGKTTTVAKLVKLLQKNNLSCVIAAADTFRAAAIDQLQIHADALNVKLIKHEYGADAAAVAFDAIKHAEAKNKDVVLIDTAGRLHSNVNLMDEMKKIVRVAKPHLKLFIGESITGNDCVEQARLFDEAVGIDGIVLSKADIDEKGGAALSISHVTKKPILYLGVGQEYDDLEPFDKDKMMKRLGL